MRDTRSTISIEASAPPQRLRSFRSSPRNPPLSPPTASTRHSSRQPLPTKPRPSLKLEKTAANQEQAPSTNVASTVVKKNNNKEDASVTLTEYERKRIENIQRNLAFMQQMGVATATIEARTAIQPAVNSPHTSATKRSTFTRKKPFTQPVRKSRRLEGKEVEMARNDFIDQMEIKNDRNVAMKPPSQWHDVMDTNDHKSQEFLQNLTNSLNDENDTTPMVAPPRDLVDYTLATDDIMKVTPERIYSLAFLPRSDRIVIACGDKVGHIALWTRSENAHLETDTNLALYRPHTNPVTQLIFSNTKTLVSSSFDGTIRAFDLHAATTSILYETTDNAGITSLVRSGIAAESYYASSDDGSVRVIDPRTSLTSRYQLHEKKINTVHQHTNLNFCIATASLDRTVSLWDVRQLSSSTSSISSTPLVTLPHHRSVNCAYFSPHPGAWLVTVGQDSYLNVFPTATCVSSVPTPLRIRHNNLTGRWLTKLHATWDPKRSNQFIIGCMEHPRRVQIFQANRPRPIRELTSPLFASVHSIYAVHPFHDFIVGGNSSGRVALWRGVSTTKEMNNKTTS